MSCPYCSAFVPVEALNKHLREDCTFNRIVKSGNYVIAPSFGVIKCPKCGYPTKLVWVSKNNTTEKPCCKECFCLQLSTSEYEVAFLPTVCQGSENQWIISRRPNHTFADLRKYLSECIDMIIKDRPEDRMTTKNRTILLQLTNVLMQDAMRMFDIMQRKGQLVDIKKVQQATDYINELRDKIREFSEEKLSIGNSSMVASIPTQVTPIVPLKSNKLNWHILPPGRHPFSEINAYFLKIASSESFSGDIDNSRLQAIYELHPTAVYGGEQEFSGYVVFYFDRKKVAVLENPFIGNAIYVIQGDWKSLSKLSKSDLLAKYPNRVIRIIHSGDWINRLKTILLK
jgi:hypothetical protein